MTFKSKILVMGTIMAAAFTATAVGEMVDLDAGDPATGKTLFKSSGCGGCHALADAGAKGKLASDLDKTKPSYVALVNVIKSPPGGMPRNSLSQQQAEDIAAYVVSVAGKHTPGPDPGNSVGGTTGNGGGKSTVQVAISKKGKLKLKPKKVPAGVVILKIRNKAEREFRLSLIRLRENKSHLTLSLKRGRVGENRRVGKKIKVKYSNGFKKAKRNLMAGKFILIENKRGNYKKKRYALLEVTQPPITSPGTKSGPSGPQLSPDAQAFVDAGCGGCHTLADAKTKSTVASDLNTAKPSYNTVKDVVTSGMILKFQSSSVADLEEMPAYNTKLTEQQIEDMARYVSTSTGGGDGSGQPAGRQDVLRTGCASCHTLADIGATASDPGGSESYSNLDIAKPNFTTTKSAVEAISSIYHMPKYKAPSNNPRVLDDAQLADVENYIANVTGGSSQPNSGRQTYLLKGCSSCHTLADAGGVGERASSLDVGKPHYDTIMRILDHNMGTSGTATPKRWGLTPGMPNRKSYSAQDKADISTYLSNITGGASQDPASGRQLSLVGGCGNCHVIADTDGLAKGTPVGPNLDERKPSSSITDLVLTYGDGPQPPTDITFGMPMYLSVPSDPWDAVKWGDITLTDVDEKFSEAEIDAIANYIRDVTGAAH